MEPTLVVVFDPSASHQLRQQLVSAVLLTPVSGGRQLDSDASWVSSDNCRQRTFWVSSMHAPVIVLYCSRNMQPVMALGQAALANLSD
jgi:hypothetical protein